MCTYAVFSGENLSKKPIFEERKKGVLEKVLFALFVGKLIWSEFLNGVFSSSNLNNFLLHFLDIES